MVGTTLKKLIDENASVQVQVKKLTVPSNEATTKRAALGDLQNRGPMRLISTKEAAQKELKDIKLPNVLPNVLRHTKARVDSHWKKQPLGQSNNNGAATKATTGGGSALLRSNSLRTVVGAAASSTALPRQASNLLKKEVKEEAPAQLRREDSNLSRKSLTKLRAALASKPASGGATKEVKEKPTVTTIVAPTKPLAMANRLLKPRPAVACVASVALSTKRLGVEDIDAEDGENLVLVSEYVNDIYDYLYQLEVAQPIKPDFLAGQLEVTPKMRAVLIDWINEVHMQFHLAAETFQLAVAIIDRYLQVVRNTKRSHLQLVGVTALFIATKYEELFPPAIGDFVYITDDTYTARQIRMMELQIFKAIDCNLSRPLPIHFLRRYSKAAGAEDSHHAMSKYLLELASLEYELASYRPSEIAAASLFLSLHLLNGNAKAATGFNDKHWTPTLVHYSRYSAKQLRPISQMIAKLAREASHAKLRAVFSKYQVNKFQKIALRPELYGALMDSIVGKK